MTAVQRRKAQRKAAGAVVPGADGAAWQVRVAAAIVVLVALWPLCHRVLIALSDANPWKLGGFAMYSAPAPPLLVTVYGLRQGKLEAVDARTLPADARAALQRFEVERHALGRLRRPDDVARRILDAAPELSQLSVVVQRMRLHPGSAQMQAQRMQYSYDRNGPREVRQMRTSTTTP